MKLPSFPLFKQTENKATLKEHHGLVSAARKAFAREALAARLTLMLMPRIMKRKETKKKKPYRQRRPSFGSGAGSYVILLRNIQLLAGVARSLPHVTYRIFLGVRLR